MVATAERMGFEVGEGAGAGRSSAAVSWCFHEELAEQLIRRMAPHVPWAVAIHSPDSPAPRADQLPDLNGVAPWVRSTGGVPEGMYTLAGLNCRMRVYRYESGANPNPNPNPYPYPNPYPNPALTGHHPGPYALPR